MIICICANISNSTINEELDCNPEINFLELQSKYNICNQCMCCKHDVIDYIASYKNKNKE